MLISTFSTFAYMLFYCLLNSIVVTQPIELWSGKQLFSVLLRPHASVRVYLNLMVKERNYTNKIIKKIEDKEIEVETMCPNDGFVYIRNSELICGQLGKATLGESCFIS